MTDERKKLKRSAQKFVDLATEMTTWKCPKPTSDEEWEQLYVDTMEIMVGGHLNVGQTSRVTGVPGALIFDWCGRWMKENPERLAQIQAEANDKPN